MCKSWNKFRNTAGYCNCNIKRILNGDRLHPTCSTKLSDYHCIKMCAVIQFLFGKCQNVRRGDGDNYFPLVKKCPLSEAKRFSCPPSV